MSIQRQIIDISSFPGGVALWAAVPPAYDTTNRERDQGIHVHAREGSSDSKVIDETYQNVDIIHTGRRYPVDELDAIRFMISATPGFQSKPMFCNRCVGLHRAINWPVGHSHLDYIHDGSNRGAANMSGAITYPISYIRNVTGLIPPPCTLAKRELAFRQEDYAGGIQIWASNPAILWSSQDRPPEKGIHVHAYAKQADENPEIDDTFAKVVIDGYELNEADIRSYMAQCALRDIANAMDILKCDCGIAPFCKSKDEYAPKVHYNCDTCSRYVMSVPAKTKIVCSPFLNAIEQLRPYAVNAVRDHCMQLLRQLFLSLIDIGQTASLTQTRPPHILTDHYNAFRP